MKLSKRSVVDYIFDHEATSIAVAIFVYSLPALVFGGGVALMTHNIVALIASLTVWWVILLVTGIGQTL